jgi:1,4-dihydroxy-2-naphthoate octaprenyltransferase
MIWKKMSFWNKLKATFASLGIGTEVALFASDSAEFWRWITIFATLIVILITNWIQDENNNGIPDTFE